MGNGIGARMMLLAILLVAAGAGVHGIAGHWLDRPLASWNAPGVEIPVASSDAVTRDALVRRCALTPRQTTTGEQALFAAGWIPQLHLDRELVDEETEIVAGFDSATDDCLPSGLNLFVFVGGRFAGTLSPDLTRPGTDGAIGAVRISGDRVAVEFARYTPADTECCPSSRVRVTFEIERSGAAPTVVPVSLRTVRGQ